MRHRVIANRFYHFHGAAAAVLPLHFGISMTAEDMVSGRMLTANDKFCLARVHLFHLLMVRWDHSDSLDVEQVAGLPTAVAVGEIALIDWDQFPTHLSLL